MPISHIVRWNQKYNHGCPTQARTYALVEQLNQRRQFKDRCNVIVDDIDMCEINELLFIRVYVEQLNVMVDDDDDYYSSLSSYFTFLDLLS